VSTSSGRRVREHCSLPSNKQITTSTIEGQILKAKPKQVLTITASAHSRLSSPNQQALGMYAKLNGAYIDYSGFGGHCPQASNFCSVSGQWIVDLDAAEAAAPGTVMGHPLDVDVDFQEGFLTVAENVHLTMAVRMEKKR